MLSAADRRIARVAVAIAAVVMWLAVPGVALAAQTFMVSNASDAGAGSLRAAITSLNDDSNDAFGAQDTIEVTPGDGPFVVNLATALPQLQNPVMLQGAGITINAAGVTTADTNGLVLGTDSDLSTVRGLTIEGANAAGLAIVSGNNTITGNTIGTAASGNAEGIDVFSSSNTIGGTSAAAGNTVTGSTYYGIELIGPTGSGPSVTDNTIEGNTITATTDAGNADAGVAIVQGATSNTIGGSAGAGNVIAGNHGYGVYVSGSATTGNDIDGNDIGTVTGELGGAQDPNSLGGVEFTGGAQENEMSAGTVIAGSDSFAIDVGHADNSVEDVSLQGGPMPIIAGGAGGTVTMGTPSPSGNGYSTPFTITGAAPDAAAFVTLLGDSCTGGVAQLPDLGDTSTTTDSQGDATGEIDTTGDPSSPVAVAYIIRAGTIGLSDPCPAAGGTTGPTGPTGPAGASGSAPVNTALPQISGSAVQGQTLTTSNGTWSNTPTAFDYQWEECDDEVNNCTDVAGATDMTYPLATADVGQTIRVMVTAGNASGDGSPVTSASTAVVTAPPVIPGPSVPVIAMGGGPGDLSIVTVIDVAKGTVLSRFLAFGERFTGGVSLAWVNTGEGGMPDLIVGSGPGAPPEVKVYSGTSLSAGDPSPLAAFMPLDAAFLGGLSVAAGDVTGDGQQDVVVGAGREFGLFKLADLIGPGATSDPPSTSFDSGLTGPLSLAVDDDGGGGAHDLVVGAGSGAGPQVEVLDGTKLIGDGGPLPAGALLAHFLAFSPGFTGGVSVAADDITGSGAPEVIAGAGPGMGAVDVFSAGGGPLNESSPFGSFQGGVNVAASGGDLLTAPSTGGSGVNPALLFSGVSTTPQDLFVPVPGLTGGLSVAADIPGSATSSTPLAKLPPLAIIGDLVTTGVTASVPVGCGGSSGTQCTVTVTLTAPGPSASAAAAGKRHKPTHRAVVLGRAKVTIRAGASKTLKASLNAAGKRLLAKKRKLKVRLVITQGGRTVRAVTVVLRAKPAHHTTHGRHH